MEQVCLFPTLNINIDYFYLPLTLLFGATEDKFAFELILLGS